MSQPVRRSPSRLTAVLGLAVLAVALLVVAVRASEQSIVGAGSMFAHPAYVPAPDRTAEWTGNPQGPLSDDAIAAMATGTGIEVLPKFADHYDLSGQFTDVRKLAAAAKAQGNPLEVFAYFSASFWFTQNETGWGPYARSFSPSWFLTDRTGARIPFYGQGSHATPVGYLLDLRSPEYRAWALRTIVSWMHQAPFSGVAFDSANPLLPGATVRRGLGGGVATDYPSLLCGTDTPGCSVITDWNTGLQDLLQQATQTLHQMGKHVMYNGIAPSVQRQNRNLATLQHADIAANEAFCYSETGTRGAQQLTPTSITDDATVMREAAADGKSILQITDYGDSSHRGIGDYCVAAFLIGWQPGHSWYVFHTGYSDPLSGSYPEAPEQGLALGRPTASYQTHGGVLSRTFDHGFVAVNTGSSSGSVTVPVRSIAFSGGLPGRTFRAGATAQLAPHTALFVLSTGYLDG